MELKEKVKLWRSRFSAREEVFGRIETKIIPGKKKPKKFVNPVYVDRYRSAKSREGKVFERAEELYVPLGDEHVESHIQGRMEIMVYTPRLDGTTKFFAVDFDFQHGFEEVQAVSKALSHHEIPHAIARSTTKGHHIYVFFDDFVESYYITNYLKVVFQDLGYFDRLKNGDIVGKDPNGNDIKWTNPEVFPKVITVSGPTATGNGIKPALNGKALENDRCCFVDYNDKVIGGSGQSDEQWEYLKNIPEMKVSALKKLLDDLKVSVEFDMMLSEKRGATKQTERKRSIPYQAPDDGDLMLVVNGCPALRRAWESPPKDIPHEGRVALLSFALKCKNGVQLIRDKFGDSEHTNKQITYAMETSQKPWSCKTLQDYGLCLKGKDPLRSSGETVNASGEAETDFCFEKSPPREIINGKIKINPDNLSEADWPWPSPIRNRTPFQKKGVYGLKREIDSLSKESPELDDKLESLFKKYVSLPDKKAQDEIFDYLKSKKLAPVKTLKSFEKMAREHKKEESERQFDSMDGFRVSNDIRYSTLEGDGYTIVRAGADGEDEFVTISNFEIELDYDVSRHPIVGETERGFEGAIRCKGKSYPFKVSSDEYSNNTKLASVIFSAVGPEADFKNSNLEYIRAAVSLFGTSRLKVINTYEDYGFDHAKVPKVYRSTSGNISANGFQYDESNQNSVDLSGAMHARHLGLEDLSKTEFHQTVRVIKDNILNMQERKLTLTMVAHAVQAVIHNIYIPFNESPVMWIQGLTGVGKSVLAHIAQNFHGDFPKPMSIQTTLRSMDQYAMVFKDALLVLDDFKKAMTPEKVIVPFIQKIYDRSERGRLQSNLKQSNTVNCRGLVMITAEDPPTSEASVMARLVYLEASQKLTGSKEEAENYRVIMRFKDKLSGVTAKFVQYMLENYQDPTEIHEKFYDVNEAVSAGVVSEQNAPRIINNLAANYLSWKVFLEFLQAEDAITKDEFEELRLEHWDNILEIRKDMLFRCATEQASNVFLNILRQGVASGECQIDGIQCPNDKAPTIGYCMDQKKGEIYIYPDIAYRVVKRILRESDSFLSHSKESIGRQLLQDGYIFTHGENATTVRKMYKQSRNYVWALDGLKAGLLLTLKEVESGNDSEEELPPVNEKRMPLEDM